VIFVSNKILSITKIEKRQLIEDDLFYSSYNKHLIYALINANTLEEARKRAEKLIEEFTRDNTG
jgi:hypothetical protein